MLIFILLKICNVFYILQILHSWSYVKVKLSYVKVKLSGVPRSSIKIIQRYVHTCFVN